MRSQATKALHPVEQYQEEKTWVSIYNNYLDCMDSKLELLEDHEKTGHTIHGVLHLQGVPWLVVPRVLPPEKEGGCLKSLHPSVDDCGQFSDS